MHTWLKAICGVLGVFVCATTVWAQGADTGSLRGRLTDASGAALPGVTVTASSAAVMGGSIVTVSSGEGFYRFPSLPPGVYKVTMELEGFKTVSIEGLRINVGLGLTSDRQLEVADFAETLTIVSEAPIVDTRNTAAGAVVTNEILQLIPSSRDLWNTVQQVPGLVVPRENVGGFESTQLSSMSVHGSGASAVQHNVNGIDMTLMHQDNLGAGYMNTDAFEEIQVTTSGISAEHSRGGLIINQVVKTGGNAFRGLAGYYFENDRLMAANVDDDLRQRGVRTEGSPLDHLVDLSAQLGGPILKDKLWFFESFRQYNVYPYVLNCLLPDGTRCTNQAKLRNITSKLSGEAGAANRFMFMYEYGQKLMPNRDISQFVRPEASFLQDGAHDIWQGKYERILSPTMLLDASYGQLASPFPLRYRDGVGDKTTAFDEITRVRFDAPAQNFFQRGRMRTARANVTHFKDNLFGAAHDFKFGFEWRDGEVPETTDRNGDLQRNYRNGVASQVIVYNTPVVRNATNIALMGFAQDSIRKGRLTMTAGVRVEKWRADLPAQSNRPDSFAEVFGGAQEFPAKKGLIAWTSVSPRVGAIYDLTGNSRVVLKTSYGRYFSQIEGNRVNNTANLNSVASATYDWRDINGNNYPDYPVEFGTLRALNLPRLRSIQPDLKSPFNDEVSASVDFGISSRMSFSTRYTYRKNHRMLTEADLALPDSVFTVPSTATDPVTGGTIEYFSLDPRFRTVTNDIVLTQFDSNWSRYHGVDFVLDRRFDGRWLARASVTLQDNYGRVGGYSNRNDANIFAYGAFGLDAKQLVRLQGTYRAPLDVMVGAAYRSTGGLNSFAAGPAGPSPMARVVQVRDVTNNALYPVRVEENGSYRQKAVNVLDLRASKVFRFGERKIEGMIDVFNVLNANNILAASAITGPTFGVPSTVLTPRVARVGIKVDF